MFGVSVHLETKIPLTPENPCLLIVENPHEYVRIVQEMQKAVAGACSDFSFWQASEEISLEKKGEMLTDGFSFELGDKKIINLLYKTLQKNYNAGDYICSFQEIVSKINCFLLDLCETIDFSSEYEDITLEDLLKVCSVKPAKTYKNLLEKILCYIDIFVELKNIDVFIFVGLKALLTDEDLQLFYKHCLYRKVSLLLLEPSKLRPLLPEEKAILITEDLCEIVENFSEV